MLTETTQSPNNVTTTTTETTPIIHPVLKNDLKFLIIPLIVMVVVMVLSALVYLMAKRRRSEFVRENLMRLYEFDSNENEWDIPLMNSGEENYGSLNNYSDYSATSL
ncbi:hypothetical protein ILUMI_09618 [Ignelater luminosus]|uniref:Uncharacterized protein n=1 Tax=Ignelater luminosus TaxID=2038154 RepID=A0A8K0D4R1_IGNLU|nr:hypothetical protein ILUMI_09618 [Ignelater luminosus]